MPEEPKKSLIDVSDLAGLSKPLTKLIEVVAAGLGRAADVFSFAKRDADNDAYKILTTGSAETQVAIGRMQAVAALGPGGGPPVQKLTLSGLEVSAELTREHPAVLALKERSEKRTEYQNLIHQLNTEHAVNIAIDELSQEGTTVSDEPVDADWTARYFNIVQDISSEELQAIWGRVLAGKIKEPTLYSLRTLEVLKNLTQKEAILFSQVCPYVLVSRQTIDTFNYALFKGLHQDTSPFSSKFDYSQVVRLVDCGLVRAESQEIIEFAFEAGVQANFCLQISSKLLYIGGVPTESRRYALRVYQLTTAGAEISRLVSMEAPLDYVTDLVKTLLSEGLSAKLGDFTGWLPNGGVEYDSMQDFQLED